MAPMPQWDAADGRAGGPAPRGSVAAAVVGCGNVSVVHFQAIRAMQERGDAHLAAVCDTDAGTAELFGRTSSVAWYTDVSTMLDEQKIDVLHVCTPHDQHVPVILAALDAGVHVLTEKPLAHSFAEAQRVTEAAASHPDLKVGVCFQNRYNATSHAVRALLRSGSLGEVRGAWAGVVWHREPEYYRTSPWRGQKSRSGGGVLINQAIHTVDLLQWFLGDVTEVSGQVSSTPSWQPAAEVDVEDTAHLVMDHAGGARSFLLATLAGPVDSPVVIEITTENAVLFLRGDLTISWSDGRVETVPERRTAPAGSSYWGSSHAELIDDFYRSLPDAAPFWIGPADALAVQRLLTAVYEG